jgi:hypothetical protein
MMPSYIQNYGFTKTIFQDNNSPHNEISNLVEWKGDYDGKIANIDLEVNDNGNKKFVNLQLNNDDIKHLFGIQPVEVPLEKRLVADFLYKSRPISLEGAIIKRKSCRYRRKLKKKQKTTKNKKMKKNRNTKKNKNIH